MVIGQEKGRAVKDNVSEFRDAQTRGIPKGHAPHGNG